MRSILRRASAVSGRKTSAPSPACGSAKTEFRSGESDLRGLFIAGNVHGKATVIACEGESRYAFFRGPECRVAEGSFQATIPVGGL